MNTWYNINADARVWAGHSRVQKQGWMRSGSAILAVEAYQGAVRFEEHRGPSDLKSPTNNYPEYWMQLEDLSLRQLEPDVPIGPGLQAGDAALGAAFRLLVNFILGR